MLTCKCGKKARLDDVDGVKPGTRIIYYECECGCGYTFDENTGEILEIT